MRRFRSRLNALAGALHRLTVLACVALLAVALAGQGVTVVLRYGFDTGYLWLQDLSLWSFAALAMLAIPVAVALDAHVRVDLLRERMRPERRRRLDLWATILLMFPLFGALAWLAWPQAVAAWRIGEASPQIGGLAGFWLVRFVPVAAALLALVQAAARLGRDGGEGEP